MYCKNCGNELDDNAFVCTKCGCLVNEKSRNENVKTASSALGESGPSVTRFEKASLILSCVGFLFIGVALAMCFISVPVASYDGAYQLVALILSALSFVIFIISLIFNIYAKNFKLYDVCFLILAVSLLVAAILLYTHRYEIWFAF